jgi:hypothetical protein
MRRILVLGLAAAMVLGPGWMSGAPAQEAARARLLGVWEGALKYGGVTGPGFMEFFGRAASRPPRRSSGAMRRGR